MANFHTVELKPRGESPLPADVEIDGNKIDGVASVSFEAYPDELPRARIGIYASALRVVADAQFDFSPETVRDASAIICSSFATDSEMRKGLVASIASALAEFGGDPDKIADRIIGLD